MNKKMDITVDFDLLLHVHCVLAQDIEKRNGELKWCEENDAKWVEFERLYLNESIRAYNEISRALGREYDCKEEV